MKCARTDLSRERFKGWRISAFPTIEDLESREGACLMWLTFRRGEVEQIAGTLMNEGKTGSEPLNGPAHGENYMSLTGT
jgi:hypothetical protein